MSASSALPPGTTVRHRLRGGAGAGSERDDFLAVEEPLEIRVIAESGGRRTAYPMSVTMRSPGHDFELAAGFLLAEGVVRGKQDVWRIARCETEGEADAANVVEVHLAAGAPFDPERFRRNVYTSSSCGVCAKGSIEQLRALGGTAPVGEFEIRPEAIHGLPDQLRTDQTVFSSTGGLHACGLFSADGRLELSREDVGRHNAVDKVTGRLLLDERLPAGAKALLVSGRAGFELVHKTMAAGITTLLAVGAASSLAVETAEAFGMTLIGFVRDGRFNVYTGAHRIAPGQATHQ